MSETRESDMNMPKDDESYGQGGGMGKGGGQGIGSGQSGWGDQGQGQGGQSDMGKGQGERPDSSRPDEGNDPGGTPTA